MAKTENDDKIEQAEQHQAGPVTQEVAAVLEQFRDKIDESLASVRKDLDGEIKEQADKVGTLEARQEERERTARQRFYAQADDVQRGRRLKGPFTDPQRARAFGLVVLAVSHNDSEIRQQARAEIAKLPEGLQTAAVTPESGAGGGFFAVDQFIPEVIANVDEYGTAERIFRLFADVDAEKVSRPKRGTGATVYFPDYGGKPTESELTAKKITAELTRWSTFARYDRWMAKSNLAIVLANYVADELAFAIAAKQDTCAFVGDGTASTYARIKGIFKQPATGHLRVTADSGDDTFQEVIDATNKYLAKALGALPRWVLKAGPVWLMDHQIFFGFWGMQDSNGKPLVQFLGGDSPAPFRLMGYPVEFTGVGPTLSETAVSTPVISIGAYNRGWEIYRHRAGHELRQSEHVYFLEGDMAVVLDLVQTMQEVDANAYVNIVTAAS